MSSKDKIYIHRAEKLSTMLDFIGESSSRFPFDVPENFDSVPGII